MKMYPKGSRVWDQNANVSLSPTDVIRMYESGYSGVYFDPDEYQKFKATAIQTGGYELAEEAAQAYGWYGSFKNQLVIPFVHVMEMAPGAWPGPAQQRGDCQNGSDLVRMADGSQKQIRDIQKGEYVISASGEKRVVTNVFKKPYNGKMVEISVKGYTKKIASTPDHKYIIDSYSLEGKPISELNIGDKVYLPSIQYNEEFTFDLKDYYDRDCITEDMDFKKLRINPVSEGKIRGKSSSIQVNRYIKLDEKLAWLVGTYAAEGGVDGDKGSLDRITFNLGSHEILSAQQIKQYFIDIFGIEPHVYQVPSKPTVLYVRVSSSIIATFFKYLVEGNTYTKSLSKEWFIASKSIKLALLKGWFDGDGHRQKYGAVGTSVSKELITDMADIANSTGIEFNIHHRKKHKRSKAAYNIRISSQSSKEFMVPKTQYVSSVSLSNEYGREVEIQSIKYVDPEEPFVYCIEVEQDHTFICNGFGIFNCVSHGNKNAILGTLVGEVAAGQPDEVTGFIERFPEISVEGLKNGALSTEASYYFRRHGGDGWFCGAAATVAMKEAGAVVRKNYPEAGIDLTKYSGALAGKWGRTPPPENVAKHLRNNLIRTAAKASTFEALRDNLGQGRFINSCGSEGFASTRDKNGVSSRRGSWAHAMAYIATDDRPEIVRLYGSALVLVLNSWGPSWNSGPRDIFDSAKYVPAAKKALWESLDIVNPSTGNIMIPKGSFWAKWPDISRRESYVYAGLNGWRIQKLTTLGGELWG